MSAEHLPIVLQSTLEEFRRAIEAEFIEGSAIETELFRSAVQFSTDTEIGAGGDCRDAIADFLNWDRKQAGFGSIRRDIFGALMPNEDGTPFQAKLNYQTWDSRKGRYTKAYKFPKGGHPGVYKPPVNVATRQKIAERYAVEIPEDESFWDLVAEQETPIVITEGVKKGLCLLSNGYVAVPCLGVMEARLRMHSANINSSLTY